MAGPSEFEIIARYFTARPGADVLLGIGDDAAVIDVREPVVVAVDTLVGGVHFPPDLSAHAIGHRALAVNLSDIAAMGAKPRWTTLALTLPDANETWLEGFASGFFDLAERYGVGLVGGDTTRGPLAVSVQIIGTTIDGKFLTRAGGRVGDDVYVTGTLGDSAAALPLLASGSRETAGQAELMNRFRYPTPRVETGMALVSLATAAIDVSDGLVADLGHLCNQSKCGALIDVERLPLSAALRSTCSAQHAEELALGGGDDYELCFTAPLDAAAAVESAVAGSATRCTRIGRLVAEPGVVCCRGGQPIPVAVTGYTHF